MVTDSASDKNLHEIWSSSFDSIQSSDPNSLEKFKAENYKSLINKFSMPIT
jgi:hypothetical protein